MLANEEANSSVVLENNDSLIAQESEVVSKVSAALQGQKVNAIVCVAGGWAGGNAAAEG